MLAAITPSAVHLQVVNPAFWPAFPWAELAEPYDAILPMTYWSIRKGELRDGERYVGDNLDRIRASIGDEDVPIVAVGGIADGVTTADLEGMVRAIEARGGAGGAASTTGRRRRRTSGAILQPARAAAAGYRLRPVRPPTTTSPS